MAPLAIFGYLAANDVEIQPAKAVREIAQFTGPDRPMIYRGNGTDLGTGTAIKCFFGQIQFCPVDFPLLDFHFQLVTNELNDGAACNAFQNIGGDWRCRENAVSY